MRDVFAFLSLIWVVWMLQRAADWWVHHCPDWVYWCFWFVGLGLAAWLNGDARGYMFVTLVVLVPFSALVFCGWLVGEVYYSIRSRTGAR